MIHTHARTQAAWKICFIYVRPIIIDILYVYFIGRIHANATTASTQSLSVQIDVHVKGAHLYRHTGCMVATSCNLCDTYALKR